MYPFLLPVSLFLSFVLLLLYVWFDSKSSSFQKTIFKGSFFKENNFCFSYKKMFYGAMDGIFFFSNIFE